MPASCNIFRFPPSKRSLSDSSPGNSPLLSLNVRRRRSKSWPWAPGSSGGAPLHECLRLVPALTYFELRRLESRLMTEILTALSISPSFLPILYMLHLLHLGHSDWLQLRFDITDTPREMRTEGMQIYIGIGANANIIWARGPAIATHSLSYFLVQLPLGETALFRIHNIHPSRFSIYVC
ncbi:hypothetical protein B0H19DRAFT_1377952 [Mycena capillaripes]|nr:hypothetical protein B0H19DRAFT_1377952 [Mycena capillaripes]